MYGVTKEALIRALSRKEIDEMSFSGGFEPCQAYDGFISKIGDYYECGLCKDGKKVLWKHKKEAPRHLRKFHFGLADLCKSWYVRTTVRQLCDLSSDTLPRFLISCAQWEKCVFQWRNEESSLWASFGGFEDELSYVVTQSVQRSRYK